MKTNELMIGDWVLHEGEPYQIRQLGIYGENRDGEDYPAVCIGIPNGIGLIVDRNKIESITLTAEILEKNGFVKIKTVKNIKEGDTVEISLKEIFHATYGSDDVFVCVFSDHDMNCTSSITNNPQKVAVELAAEQVKFDEETMGRDLNLLGFPGSGLMQSVVDFGEKAADAVRKGMDDVNNALESTGSVAKSLTVAVIICAAIYFYNETKAIRR